MSIKVAVRVRPFNQRQKFLGCSLCVSMNKQTTTIYDFSKKQTKFTNDYSLWSYDGYKQTEQGLYVPTTQQYIDQLTIYNILGKEIITNSLLGYNCCLFAYGQTGAGKSYSMLGYGVNKGIIPLACEELLENARKKQLKGKLQFEVYFSMLEIYNQKIQDLLVNISKRPSMGLKIRQSKSLGIYVEGLSKILVNNFKEIQKKMNEGSKNRTLASTSMNQYSSRAHTIVMIQLVQKEFLSPIKMIKKTSNIHLVDLAGSQRVSKTKIQNKDRLKQSSQINKSLHTLGKVIELLSENRKNIQIPYRQSALTRILEPALGGNSKTTMICAISPASDNYEETMATMRYADQTKKVKNKPIINETQLDKIIRQLREENERLKDILKKNQTLNTTNNMTSVSLGAEESEVSVMSANIKEIQRQIRKNLQSFAINTDNIQDEESHYFMGEYIDIEPTQFLSSELSFDLQNLQKCEAYITNLNEDAILNYKVKYSCDPYLIVGSKKVHQNNFLVLSGLGIQEEHVRIQKNQKENSYFIQVLSQLSSQYTFVNGQYVTLGSPKQLYHNDRIIVGINCVFLFKHINKVTRKDCDNEKMLTFEYSMTERQNKYSDFSIVNMTHNNSRSQENLDMTVKLEEIQKQFEELVLENQKKMKLKQIEHQKQLERIQNQKRQQTQKWQLKLKQKEEQSQRLKRQKIEIENLREQLLQQKRQNKNTFGSMKKKKGFKRPQSLNYNTIHQQYSPFNQEKLERIHQVNQTIIQNHFHHYYNNNTMQPFVGQSIQFQNKFTNEQNNNESKQLQNKLQSQLIQIVQISKKSQNKEKQKKKEQQAQQNKNETNLIQKQLTTNIITQIAAKKEIEDQQCLLGDIQEIKTQEEKIKQYSSDLPIITNNQNAIKDKTNDEAYNPQSNNQIKPLQFVKFSEQSLQKFEIANNNTNSNNQLINPRSSFFRVELQLSSDQQEGQKMNQTQSQFSHKEQELTNKIIQLENKLRQIEESKQKIREQKLSAQISPNQINRDIILKNDSGFSKGLKDSIIQCNNENIINERMLEIRKKKRQIEQFRKILIKKQKMQLQRQMIPLIPMLQRFNRMAWEMGRKIQASIQICYKFYSHFEIIQALRQKPFRSKLNVNICVENAQENRSYRWTSEIFKNRFSLVNQLFERYLDESLEKMIIFNKQDDPFWQSPEVQTFAYGYLSLQTLLYKIPYKGWVSFVAKGKIFAKIQIQLHNIIEDSIHSENEIFNPEALLQKDLHFQLIFGQFLPLQAISATKFDISYEILQNQYRSQSYRTDEMTYRRREVNYSQKHTLKNISDHTIAYISDSPICLKLNLMKELSEEVANRIKKQSFRQSSQQYEKIEVNKKWNGVIFQNNEVMDKINKDLEKQIVNKKIIKETVTSPKNKKDKQCMIY